MKKIYSIIVVSFACTSLMSQNVELCDSTVTYDTSELRTSKIVYSYDANGNKTSQTSYEYKYEDDTDPQILPNRKTVYIYDTDGNLTSVEGYSWQGSTWVGSDKTDFTYDANGFQTCVMLYTGHDGMWYRMSDEKDVFTYDAAGNPTNKDHFKWQNGKWVKVSYVDYSYNTEIQYDLYDGKWEESFKTEKEYDENGNLTCTVLFSPSYWYEEEPWHPINRYDFTYDVNSNQTSEIWYSWKDGVWVAVQKTEYSYNVNNRQTGVARYYWKDGAWVGTLKYGYTCDTDGKYISYSDYRWQNDAWSAINKKEYSYNPNGNTSILKYFELKDDWLLIETTYYYYPEHSSAIEPLDPKSNIPVENFDLQGQLIPVPVPDQLFIRNGKISIIKR